jgi:hypothetical protein
METLSIYWAWVWKGACTDLTRFAVVHTVADSAAFNARRKQLERVTLVN